MYTTVPFQFCKGKGIAKTGDIRASVASFVELLVSTPQGSCESEPGFGFMLKNFRFENVNEERGVLYSSLPNEEDEATGYYSYKIHGRSNNGQKTFALDLKRSIERYEPRLRQVRVNIEYQQQQKTVVLTVTGVTGENLGERFEHTIKIHVW